jgi:hypothetical protein
MLDVLLFLIAATLLAVPPPRRALALLGVLNMFSARLPPQQYNVSSKLLLSSSTLTT